MVESGGQRVRILRESGCSTDPQLFPDALFVLHTPGHLAHHPVEDVAEQDVDLTVVALLLTPLPVELALLWVGYGRR